MKLFGFKDNSDLQITTATDIKLTGQPIQIRCVKERVEDQMRRLSQVPVSNDGSPLNKKGDDLVYDYIIATCKHLFSNSALVKGADGMLKFDMSSASSTDSATIERLHAKLLHELITDSHPFPVGCHPYKLQQLLDLYCEMGPFIARVCTSRQLVDITYERRNVQNVKDTVKRLLSIPITADSLCFSFSDGDIKVLVYSDDVTKIPCDVIVNPSNSSLTPGQLGKLLVYMSDREFEKESQDYVSTHGGIQPGKTFTQRASGELHQAGVQYIITAVTASYNGIDTQAIPIIESAVYSALTEAEKLACKSICLPAVGAGGFHTPISVCCQAFWQALCKFVQNNPQHLKEIRFVEYDQKKAADLADKFNRHLQNADRTGSGQPSNAGLMTTPTGQRTRFGRMSRPNSSPRYSTGDPVNANIQGAIPKKLKTPDMAATSQSYDGGCRLIKQGKRRTTATPATLHAAALGNGTTIGVLGAQATHVAHGAGPTSRAFGAGSPHNLLGVQSSNIGLGTLSTYIRPGAGTTYGGLRAGTTYGVIPAGNTNSVLGAELDYEDLDVQTTDDELDDEPSYQQLAHKSISDIPQAKNVTDLECEICYEQMQPHRFTILPCNHRYCNDCIYNMKTIQKSNLCPYCKQPFAAPKGPQPSGGTMNVNKSNIHLGGYENYGSIIINYYIPNGVQTAEHPHPGQPFSGTQRTAYLPDSPDGNRVLGLLRKAFDAGLIFTVGRSLTSGAENVVVWNDIHHKTSPSPGEYGYPDPNYLRSVELDLKARGITL